MVIGKNHSVGASVGGFVPRLYVSADLAAAVDLQLDVKQTHYISHVMRRGAGDVLLFFNGRDGEWVGRIKEIIGKQAAIVIEAQTRVQTRAVDLWFMFVPLRGRRSVWLGCKAAEMGVKSIRPVLSRHKVAQEVNFLRLKAGAIEGAEQSESLFVPEVESACPLLDVLADWPEDRRLIFCDEMLARDSSRGSFSAVDRLMTLRGERSFAILVGPEGGFAPQEREAISALEASVPISLGARVMRAETAALAALTLFQAILGDW